MGSNRQGAGSRWGAEGPAPASRGAVSLLPAEGPPTTPGRRPLGRKQRSRTLARRGRPLRLRPRTRSHPGLTPSTLHRAPVGQGPPGPGWLAISFGVWSGRALATGTAWAGLCLIHHHHSRMPRGGGDGPGKGPKARKAMAFVRGVLRGASLARARVALWLRGFCRHGRRACVAWGGALTPRSSRHRVVQSQVASGPQNVPPASHVSKNDAAARGWKAGTMWPARRIVRNANSPTSAVAFETV